MSKQHHPVGRVSPKGVTRQDVEPPAHEDVGLRINVGLRFANPTYGTGWVLTTVGDFCPFKYGKGLPERDRKVGLVPVISSAGHVGYHSTAHVLSSGIVIGRKGTVGSITFSERPFWPIDTTFFVEDDPIRRDIRFTYYLLTTLGLSQMNTDSAVPGLNRDNAHVLAVKVPPIWEQRAIASTLQSLDDRITLLRETNATLEAIAQALFKSWFVDFDPVRARMEGRLPVGMDEATAALFPDSFEESELGFVPRGWRVGTVGEFFVLTMGQSPPGDTYNETGDGLPFYQGRTDFGFRFPTQRIFCTARKAACPLAWMRLRRHYFLIALRNLSWV